MKESKQPVPALSPSWDSRCLVPTITIWNFSSISFHLPADLQVPPHHIQIHCGHYWYSRNFLCFFHPCRLCPTLAHSSFPSEVSIHPPSSSQIHTFIEYVSTFIAPVRGGERVFLSLRDASKGICFPVTQYNFLPIQEAFLDHLSQSLAFLWICSIYSLASTFCNSSYSVLWHFLYYCHALLFMFRVFMLLSLQLNFKFLGGVYTSEHSSYCLDFNKFSIWFKLQLDNKIYFIECPKQED